MIHMPIRRTAPLSPALLLCLAATSIAAQPATPSARQTIESGKDQMLSVLRDAGLSAAEKGEKVGRIAEERLDLDILARLSLGQVFNEITPQQRDEFITHFREHVLSIIRTGTARYSGQDVIIAEDRTEGRADWLVLTRVIGKKEGKDREVARLGFRLRERPQGWRVIDVTIQDISLAGGFRAQFAAVMKDGGIDKLLALLREKNALHETAAKKGSQAATDQPE